MSREAYIRRCLLDIISALSVPDMPDALPVNGDWIYPNVAIQRARNLLDVDKLFPVRR